MEPQTVLSHLIYLLNCCHGLNFTSEACPVKLLRKINVPVTTVYKMLQVLLLKMLNFLGVAKFETLFEGRWAVTNILKT